MTLRVLRMREGLTQDALAHKLSDLPGRFRDHGGNIEPSLISRAERSLRLYYYLLHLYAGWSGLPSGLIYLISRCGADLRDGRVGRVKKIVRSLRAFADYLERDAARLAKLQAPSLDEPARNTEQQALARAAVLDYLRELELPSGQVIGYEGSQQQREDARLAVILDEIMAHAPPPLSPLPGEHDD
jgi:hypothetical protein